MGTKFTFKDARLGEMTVDVQSFSYSMNCTTGRAFLNMNGTIGRPQASCKFALESSKSGHRLTFRNALIWDGSDPYMIALQVKTLLLEFIKQHPDIPESFRPKFLDCILKHSKQGAHNAVNALTQTT